MLAFYLIKQLQPLILPHPHLVFLLRGQMMGNPHKVVHTPALQRRQHNFNTIFPKQQQQQQKGI
jgi:hypothetical protein